VPWAYDANGNEVGVNYVASANGKTLKMNVDKANKAAYPIVADPSVHNSWWGKTYKYPTWETNQLLSQLALIHAGTATVGALCAIYTGGVCALPWGVAQAVVLLGIFAVLICKNSQGLDIHYAWSGNSWCSGY